MACRHFHGYHNRLDLLWKTVLYLRISPIWYLYQGITMNLWIMKAFKTLSPCILVSGVAYFNHSHAIKGLLIPQIAIEPMQLTSFALSLLLVFRTNASYSRWCMEIISHRYFVTCCFSKISIGMENWYDMKSLSYGIIVAYCTVLQKV